MIPNNKPDGVSETEFANMRHNLNLLRSQIKSGTVDGKFLTKQVDNLVALFERLEVERKQRKNAARFEALYNVSRVIGSSLDLQTVLNQVMDAIIQLTGAERGFLMLRDDDGGLQVRAARNFDQKTIGSDEFKYSRTVANQVLDSGKPVVTTNAAEDPRFSGQASIIAQSLRSIMATPLRARGSVIGVVYVDSRALAGLFGEDDLAALDAFAAQAAVAIDNAILFNETDQQLAMRVNELTQLRRIDLQLNETLNADKAMLYTLEWACRLAEASGGYLGLLEGEPARLHVIHKHGDVENLDGSTFLDLRYPQVLEVIESSEAAYGEDGNAALLYVPVRREQIVIGMVILQRSGGQAFSDEQRDVVERVVARAAVAIENARLYAAVQSADRAKSEFVGIVAHDLKSPMTSILGYTDLTLLQGNLSDRQRQFLERIHNTVRRMEMLVSDLADISRIESGHFYMEEARVKVSDVLQALKDGMLPQINQRNHTYIEDLEPEMPDLLTDYFRLLQVLTNLVSNAVKYTHDNGMITLKLRQKGDRVEFTVSDTGIGLSKENILMLGTKFWRAEDDFTRAQSGTGLGFAITRSLIEQMGSRIKIESEVGKGSSFSFSVKVAPV
ncbi:MAG: GAF domain-containing protein [Chloroflexi bacterium]|nr:GAF domain-containing protein [Chloroflexota bacterium]